MTPQHSRQILLFLDLKILTMIHLTLLQALLLLVAYSLNRVSGYAHYMLNSPNCESTPLTLGYSPVMTQGGKVVAETSGKTITVKRNGISLSSGSNFVPGETLTIGVSSFSSSTGSLVFEAHGMSS